MNIKHTPVAVIIDLFITKMRQKQFHDLLNNDSSNEVANMFLIIMHTNNNRQYACNLLTGL